ncbi:MAG: hypothetical protein V7608_1863 [Hyphomicrobiales bacterium]|jgi:hypothetical protein
MITLRQLGAWAVATAALGVTALPANAWTDTGSLSLACSNGHTYGLSPRAVAIDGDLVTGYLHLSPRHAVHVRLIPMGDGYRYAGRGIWLDGIRGEATLHFGKHRSVDCSVSPV